MRKQQRDEQNLLKIPRKCDFKLFLNCTFLSLYLVRFLSKRSTCLPLSFNPKIFPPVISACWPTRQKDFFKQKLCIKLYVVFVLCDIRNSSKYVIISRIYYLYTPKFVEWIERVKRTANHKTLMKCNHITEWWWWWWCRCRCRRRVQWQFEMSDSHWIIALIYITITIKRGE